LELQRKLLTGDHAIPPKRITISAMNNESAIEPPTKMKNALNNTPMICPHPLAAGLAVCATSVANVFPLVFANSRALSPICCADVFTSWPHDSIRSFTPLIPSFTFWRILFTSTFSPRISIFSKGLVASGKTIHKMI
jgi:hypothetical protein